MVHLYLAALMPGYRRRGVLGLLATLPRMLILLPPWLAATIYVAALSVAIAFGAGALLSLQVRLGSATSLGSPCSTIHSQTHASHAVHVCFRLSQCSAGRLIGPIRLPNHTTHC